MTENTLMFKGMTAEQAFTAITDTGVTASDASRFLAGWIYENMGRSLRTFAYATDFPAVDEDCAAPAFARRLQHADWVDGESAVQAEQTTGEDGFNKRFHDIEADVDALAGDIAKAFVCVAEMRDDLHAILEELRDELNRLNTDVYELSAGSSTGPGFDPTLEGVATTPIGREYVTTTKFLDQYVQVFKGADGLTMLPAIEQSVVNPSFDPRVARTAKLGRFVFADPRVRERFGQGRFALDQFVETFGHEEVSGMLVSDLVAILPADSRFSSLDELVGDVAVREGAALKTSDTGETAVINAFGLDVDVTRVALAPIERYAAVPKDARVALAARGIATVGALIEAGAVRVGHILRDEQIAAGIPDAAEWIAGARALTAVR